MIFKGLNQDLFLTAFIANKTVFKVIFYTYLPEKSSLVLCKVVILMVFLKKFASLQIYVWCICAL